ncbi:beta family protein [Nesterenkonia sp. E16_7]|nr:beta family protein [Nesterenkonia sp. E16_10]MBO0595210.1 beta family protein [Nesterenkonia sp. E16_10]MBO0598909.1 beta family protein [Nesterenkonia sp. E16_7]
MNGKSGELLAWKNASLSCREVTGPLFEVPLTDAGPEESLTKFVRNLMDASRPGDIVGLDTSLYSDPKISSAAESLNAAGVSVRFVIRPGQDRDLARSLTESSQDGQPILRIGGNDSDPESDEDEIQAVLEGVELDPRNVHLLIDLGAIHGTPVAPVRAITRAHLTRAMEHGSWASATLALGAFPQQITDVPKGQVNPIDRADALVWNQVHGAYGSLDLRFGDYGIRHPELPVSSPFTRGPLPNLRYTAENEWMVWREAKITGSETQGPNESFYTVCANVVALPEFSGRNYSWGDEQIYARRGGSGGQGTAVQWIAYGTSHHLEFVSNRLTTTGAA